VTGTVAGTETSMPPPLVLDGRPLPLLSRARVYVCGITPYSVTHLGHAATFVWLDTAVRVLRHHDITVEVCRNVTDVDDVLTEAARQAGTPYDELAAMEQFSFDRAMSALGVARPDHEPRAHSYITPVLRLTAALLATGHAYERDRTVYLRGGDVAERHGLPLDEAVRLLAEYGEDPDDPAKEHPLDVPLWRASEADQPAWASPWGPGRPGWHSECAAMAMTVLGPAVDLHGGGADLTFPHHAYEAVIAERASGVTPFARRWMRVGLVRYQGAKMAKSTGNLVLVSDLLARSEAAAIRLMLLQRRWWEPWDYSPDALDAASGALARLYAAAGKPAGADGVGAVAAALRDDLDVPTALAAAEDAGGAAARFAVHVLGLDAAHR
jgi:cysteinyl-tRNA synthetase